MSILDGKENLAVGKLVKFSIRELFSKKEIPNVLLQMFQEEEYSKEMFGFKYPLLVKILEGEDYSSKVIISGSSRYWTDKLTKINDENYFICNDWYNGDGKKTNNKSKYKKWFLEIEEKLKDN